MNIYKANKQGNLYLCDKKDENLDGALWVDIEDPTDEDIDKLNKFYKIKLPNAKLFMKEMSVRRFDFHDNTHLFVPRLLCQGKNGRYYTAPINFIISKDFFISLRKSRPLVINSFNKLISTQTSDEPYTPPEVFYLLMFTLFRDYANYGEEMSDVLNNVAEEVFSEDLEGQNSRKHKNQIDRIARTEYLNSRIINSLMGLSLMGDYFDSVDENLQTRYGKRFDANVESLIENSNIISDRIDFVLNAVISVINLEQNRVVNVFSVFTVIFTIPAVLVGLWGMNFKYMLGLSWYWGYPIALVIIVLSGWLPFVYVRKKGWL